MRNGKDMMEQMIFIMATKLGGDVKITIDELDAIKPIRLQALPSGRVNFVGGRGQEYIFRISSTQDAVHIEARKANSITDYR